MGGLVSEWHPTRWVISRVVEAEYLGELAMLVFRSALEYYSDLGLVAGNSIFPQGARGSGRPFD